MIEVVGIIRGHVQYQLSSSSWAKNNRSEKVSASIIFDNPTNLQWGGVGFMLMWRCRVDGEVLGSC